MIAFVNCSPRLEKSNSKCFIDDIISDIEEEYNISFLYRDEFKNIYDLIIKSKKVVFVFPLYVDSPPSKLIEFFEYINKLEKKNKIYVYTICQCGFLEAKHNDIAVKIIECFCINNNFEFLGSFKIGAGEVLGKSSLKKYKILNYDYYNKLKIFCYNLENMKYINLETTVKLSGIQLYTFFANIHWKKEIKNQLQK